MSCTICFEKFTTRLHKRVGCSYCEEAACRACVEKYLLTDTATEPNCPSCRGVWNREVLNDSMSSVFLNGSFKDHRGKVLMDRERARFPDTQEEAALYKNAKEQGKLIQDEINRLRKESASKISKEMRAAAKHYGILLDNFGRATRCLAKPKERTVFIQKCPANDCEGFLSTQWKCGLCNGDFCKDCHEAKNADHTCNPELVESVKAIKKEAKPCPKCAAQISKIDGCDQMWCTQCHTAFSWISGKIETHVVHNPHYFQWMREQGIVPLPNPNLNQCIPHGLTARIVAIPPTPVALFHTMTHLMLHYLRNFQEIQQYNIPRFRHKCDPRQEEEFRRRLRVRRMVNEITDEQWQLCLKANEQNMMRQQARLQLYEMYVAAGMDILGQFMNDDYNVHTIHAQLRALDDFAINAQKKWTRVYKSGIYHVLPNNVPRNVMINVVRARHG